MIQVHLLNQVKVKQPRWSTRDILPSVRKFADGYNVITIAHHNYPSLYIMSKKQAMRYPQETMHSGFGDYQVYVIPLDDLVTLQEFEKERKEIKEKVQAFGWA